MPTHFAEINNDNDDMDNKGEPPVQNVSSDRWKDVVDDDQVDQADVIQPAWKNEKSNSVLFYVISLLTIWEIFVSCVTEWGITLALNDYKSSALIEVGTKWLADRMPIVGETLYHVANPEKYWSMIRKFLKPFVVASTTLGSRMLQAIVYPLMELIKGFYSNVPSQINAVLTSFAAVIMTSCVLLTMEIIGIISGWMMVRPSWHIVTLADQPFYWTKGLTTVYVVVTLVVLRTHRIVTKLLKRWFPWLTIVWDKITVAANGILTSICNVFQAPYYGFLRASDYVIALFSKTDATVLESKTKVSLTGDDGKCRIRLWALYLMLMSMSVSCAFHLGIHPGKISICVIVFGLVMFVSNIKHSTIS